MLKIATEVLLFSLVCVIPLTTNSEDSSVYFTGSLTVLLVFYYLIFRKGFSWKKDQPILLIFLGLILTDAVNIYGSVTNESIPLQYFFPLIYQFGLIFAFRQEGTRVVFKEFYDYLKVGIPSLIFFMIFGFYALDHPNLFEYMSMFVGSLFITLLIILSFFRPTVWHNRALGFLGASAIGISTILYFLMDIKAIENSHFPYMNGFYLLSEFFLVKAILDNLNKGRNNLE